MVFGGDGNLSHLNLKDKCRVRLFPEYNPENCHRFSTAVHAGRDVSRTDEG